MSLNYKFSNGSLQQFYIKLRLFLAVLLTQIIERVDGL